MAAPRKGFVEREREAREEAQRKTKLSLRLGVLGVVVLFASGLGALLLADYVLAFLGGMVIGILVILWAFLLVRASVLSFKADDRTKIL